MKNITIHDKTDKKYEQIKRMSHFFINKLLRSNHLGEKDHVKVWLEQNKQDYTCKIIVNRDHHSPLFFEKKSQKVPQAIKEAALSLRHALNSRDQIWKTRS